MGASKSKAMRPQNGNVENDQVIAQLQQQKPVKLNDAVLFGGAGVAAAASPRHKVTSSVDLRALIHKAIIAHGGQTTTPSTSPELEVADDDVNDKAPQLQVKGAGVEAEEEEKKSASAASSNDLALPKDKYTVAIDHVKIPINEFLESVKVTGKHKATHLLTLFDKVKVDAAELAHWKGDYGTTLGSKADCRSKMKSVVDYAEDNKSCTPAVKTKLRVVTKLIMDDNPEENVSNYLGIFLLIASHGNVCNVMKEVAINNAYHIMTGGLSQYVQSQTLQQQILKVLRDLRVVVIETVFHSFKFTNNTHYIAGFHNTIAEQVGVVPYNDPNICHPSSSKDWKKDLDKRFFAEFYTMDRILEYIQLQIDSKKIGYQKVVAWFEEHCPKGIKKTDFLGMAIDIDTGKFQVEYLCFLLEKMDVLMVKPADWKPIPKTWS